MSKLLGQFLTATNEHQVERKSIENSVLIIYESCKSQKMRSKHH